MTTELSTGWSWFIALVSIANILACLWLIAWASVRRENEPGEKETTGHVWDDDLAELNQPMPFWWLGLFIVTIVFGLMYLLAYPGLGNYNGMFKWSQARQHETEVSNAEHRFERKFAEFADMDMKTLAQQPEATDIGRKVFQTWCTGCHGSDARGAKGYPNLADNDWLYGGEPEQILASIANGRAGMMPPWQAMLGDSGVAAVVAYLQNPDVRTNGKVVQGMMLFEKNCTACHGANGEGNIALGAPNLMDDIWLYGGDEYALTESIAKGRMNARMPAHKELIGAEKLRLLTAYIYSLSQE